MPEDIFNKDFSCLGDRFFIPKILPFIVIVMRHEIPKHCPFCLTCCLYSFSLYPSLIKFQPLFQIKADLPFPCFISESCNGSQKAASSTIQILSFILISGFSRKLTSLHLKTCPSNPPFRIKAPAPF